MHVCVCLYMQGGTYTNTHGHSSAPKVPVESPERQLNLICFCSLPLFPAVLTPDRLPPSQGLCPTLTLELPEEIHGALIHVIQVAGQMSFLLRDFAWPPIKSSMLSLALLLAFTASLDNT